MTISQSCYRFIQRVRMLLTGLSFRKKNSSKSEVNLVLIVFGDRVASESQTLPLVIRFGSVWLTPPTLGVTVELLAQHELFPPDRVCVCDFRPLLSLMSKSAGGVPPGLLAWKSPLDFHPDFACCCSLLLGVESEKWERTRKQGDFVS